jgi:ATP-dependent DNA helicase RecG
VVESPGGLPPGITLENILNHQSPRNRRIAEVFEKCGLVERSGQGMDLMFEESIRQGKLAPSFAGTDDYQVVVTLHGEVQDSAFVRFLEQVGLERTASFSTQDFLLLDLIHRDEPVPEELHRRLPNLVELGVVESIGRGRGTRHILARRFYAMTRRKGAYTRKRGLDRETNKQLLLKHITDNACEGSKMADLLQVLPGHSRGQVKALLAELKRQGMVTVRGRTKGASWFPRNARRNGT